MIKYTVSMTPSSHYFEVTVDISNFHGINGAQCLRLVMPTWTPGSYLIREFSRNVLDLVALDVSGRILESYKTSKNTWQIETGESKEIRVKYQVYSFEFTVDTSYLDNLHATINGASVFMYVEGLEREEVQVTIKSPENWKELSTGLELVEVGSGIKTFRASNFDILIDSPIEIGNHKTYSFNVNGVTHEVSIFSREQFDQTKLVSDLKKIVGATVPIFSQIPYNRYVFLIDFGGDNVGGLEHLNSTHCIASIYKFEPEQEYRRFLSLFSHEFFHAWNVKRMRPSGLGPFDYSKEVYTKSLWIAEGITSYYDDLILRRAQIYTVAEYLDVFSTNVNIMKSLPGNKWQSADEASFDAWIKHYRQNENSPNVLSSYYVQGAVLGWMLDMEIMRATGLEDSLDHALKKLYDQTYVKEGRGYDEEEFESICREIIGAKSAKEIFDLRVRGRREIDFDKYLGYVGLKTVPKKPQEEQGFLGMKLRQEQGKLLVSTILSQSAAENCGLSSSDEIIAVDGIRMDLARCTWYLANKKSDSLVKILASRLGTLLDLEARITTKPVLEYKIVKLEEASLDQRKLFENWMKDTWDNELKYEEYIPSPTRRPIFDYI